MRYNISTDIICLLLMTAISFTIYRQRKDTFQGRLYIIIYVVTVAELIIEILSSIMFSSRVMTEIVLTLYYLTFPLLGSLWTMYICTLTDPKMGKKDKRVLFLAFLPYIVYSVICLSNPLTNNLFTLTEDLQVIRSDLSPAINAAGFAIYALTDIYFIIRNHKKIKNDNAVIAIIFLYIFMIGLGIFTQAKVRDWLILTPVFTVIFVITYFTFQNNQVNSLSKSIEELEKSKREALTRAMAEERFRLVARDSNDIVFEINLVNQTVSANENYYKTFGEEAGFDLGWEERTVHPDDRKKFHEVKHRLQKAEKGVPLELRLRTKTGEYKWFLLTISAFTDDDGYITRVMGKYSDIDLQTHERELLKRRVQLDTATGLYNKSATEELISIAVNNKSQPGSAVLITDIDDLKKINDTLGHAEGDRAIAMVASVLKMHFRSTDIIGRIGGDEFMVLLNGTNEEDKIKSILTALCRKISSLRVGEKNDYPLRCSMGVVISKTEDDFSELYRKADKALYFVKRDTKNSFAIYDPEMENSEYQYKSSETNLQNTVMFDAEETALLLRSLATLYPFIVSINISKNSYYILEHKNYGEVFGPETGKAEELLSNIMELTHNDDRASLLSVLSLKEMARTYYCGERTMLHTGRQRLENGSYRWAKTIVILTEGAEGNLYGVVLMRAVNDRNSL